MKFTKSAILLCGFWLFRMCSEDAFLPIW